MSKKLCVTFALALALFAAAGVAAAQERSTGSSPAIEKALAEYLLQARIGQDDQDPLKAVPRTDKAEASVVGAVAFVDGTDFLSDGTPFRIIVVRSRKPITQEVFIVCLGAAFNSSCGRLGVGRRVSVTSDLLVIEEGESAGLALLVAKRLQM